MNDIMRSTLLEVAKHDQYERIRRAERFRWLAEAPERQAPEVAGLVRVPLGRAVMAVGRWIQGGSAAPKTEEFDACAALKPAR